MKKRYLKNNNWIVHIVFFTLFIASIALPITIQEPSSNDYYTQAEATLDTELQAIATPVKTIKKQPVKKTTCMIYVAADNDLRSFAARNIKQMAEIGSNEHLNIVVHLDICIAGNNKITRRYLIEKDKITLLNADDPETQRMNSGAIKTLTSFCQWAIEEFPAENYILFLWDHATGAIDPATGRIIDPSELFNFNPDINKYELDRRIEFLDFLEIKSNDYRGICWDETFNDYLTNQKLDAALNEICTQYLGGKKFAIIGFDACLMAMVEIANIMKKYADIMVGSQEVELGTGWPYHKVLAPLAEGTRSFQSSAQKMVQAYEQAYNKITNDYTQSAVDLQYADSIEDNINAIASLLIQALKLQKSSSVKIAIQASRNRLLCTHFDEPSYIDLHHFYTNLLLNTGRFKLSDPETESTLIKKLEEELKKGLALIEQSVIANAVGKNLSKARGLSIYFPERRIHSSYKKTGFAIDNEWHSFLTIYLSLQ